MSFPRYPKYKASGVEWLGDVPEGWEVVPFKHRCSRYALYGANMSSDEYVSDGVRFLRTTDISENGELEPDGVFVNPEVAREYLLKDKDILISRSGTIGRAFVFAADIHPECAYAGYLVRFVPTRQLNSRLFFYFTKSAAFSDWLQTQLIFSTIGNVNGQKYAQCRLTLPPLPEQTAIAEFLDRETGKIDELVAEQRRLMELLKEKRQAVISHAVTKGLNPHAPMKPSGIEWLGDVPEHWETRTIAKASSKITNGYVGPTRDILVESGTPYIQATHIKKGRVNFDDGYFVTPEWSKSHAKSILAEDDVLIVQTGAGTGDIGLVSRSEVGFNCHALIIVASLKDLLSGAFLSAVLQSDYGHQKLESIQTGGMHPHLNCGNVKFIEIPMPPVVEQQAIVTFIANELSKFDTLTAEAQRAIDLLQERRTALISAAVTGQIDVRQQNRN